MNKKELKRREEKEGNSQKKRSKSYTKKEKQKKVRAFGRTGYWYILTSKYCRKDQRSCDGWGRGSNIS
jgi:hypothetical protein